VDYQVIIGRPAQQDLVKIHDYIARHNPMAAQAFVGKLVEEAKSLKTFPQRGGQLKEKPGVRFTVVGPYLIVDRVVEIRQEVRVQRFWHAARERRRLRRL